MTDQRNGHRAVLVTVPCRDCGRPFDTSLLMGRQTTFSCGDCTNARFREFELDREEKSRLYRESRLQAWIEDARGIPRKYRGFAWEDFAFDRGGEGNRDKVRAIREYAEAFPVDAMPFGYPSMVLASETNGVGKTLLACLMLDTIYRRGDPTIRERPPAQFWPVHEIKQRLASAARYTSQETQEEVVRNFATIPLLVMDDVGKERLSGQEAEVAYDTYFSILNARYNGNLPVVLTTNLGMEPWAEGDPSLVDLLGRASVSRLAEMTEGKIYVIEGEDRR